MKLFLSILFVAISGTAISGTAVAQTADVLYRQACGPKDAKFVVQRVQGQPPSAPEPGKALVYFIQEEKAPFSDTKVGVDGAWVGVLQNNSYTFASVTPGEHHACARTQARAVHNPKLIRFNAEAGKVYYFFVRTFYSSNYYNVEFDPADPDEALYLIASDPQSIAKPKP